ncbi:AraC family transcriptional regulator [Nitratireductor pacificus]|uniref:AraC type helix-turn-helix-domain containing protein n=1 Tax=Nitratireductor pacificus pht-3B TaxID=391937 RepID=K2M6V7_9HYPH|nr:helix-turn-helix transcriptional regulator [Nitratireductor pacificus]EKF17921.1 AraC type helix-turn-helix- domain containing protein [Nitratireductor pacificus pht-3B]
MRDFTPEEKRLAREMGQVDVRRRAWLEQVDGDVVVWQSVYSNGFQVAGHQHSRSQLLHVCAGVVLVKTVLGHWMVPVGHAIWIPAGIEHAVDMLGGVRMQSAYISPGAIDGLPDTLRVVGVTDLMQSLLDEAVPLPHEAHPSGRGALLHGLILHEIPRLREMPLGLPFPTDSRLAGLCLRFLETPSSRVTIDSWAAEIGMSRRSFTRKFQQETGIGLSLWRQQASLFAALPRLTAGESVTNVALDLGYESVAAFTTMFKRMLGASPRSYLRVAPVKS